MDIRVKYLSIAFLVVLISLVPVRAVLADGDSEETERVILALFEAFNRHDTEAIVRLYSEDARIRSPGDTEPLIGREVVRDIYNGHFENIPGVHDAVQNIISDGDRGSVEFIASWDQPTDDDPMARGKLRIATFITVKDGQIIEDVTYYDRMELAEHTDIENRD